MPRQYSPGPVGVTYGYTGCAGDIGGIDVFAQSLKVSRAIPESSRGCMFESGCDCSSLAQGVLRNWESPLGSPCIVDNILDYLRPEIRKLVDDVAPSEATEPEMLPHAYAALRAVLDEHEDSLWRADIPCVSAHKDGRPCFAQYGAASYFYLSVHGAGTSCVDVSKMNSKRRGTTHGNTAKYYFVWVKYVHPHRRSRAPKTPS